MIKKALPFIDDNNNMNVKIPEGVKLWWSSKKAKAGYKNLDKKYKTLCKNLIQDIVSGKDLTKYGEHYHNVKGVKDKITNVHLEPNISAEADTMNNSIPIKHKGKYLLIFHIKVFDDYLIYEILNIGDHSILSEDYSDIK